MKNKLVKKILNNGFTMTEVIIVIVIIAVLVLILLPNLVNMMPDDHVVKYKKAYTTIQQAVSNIASECQGMKWDSNNSRWTAAPVPKQILLYCYRTDNHNEKFLADEISKRLNTTDNCTNNCSDRNIRTTNGMYWWFPNQSLAADEEWLATIYVNIDNKEFTAPPEETNPDNGIYRIYVYSNGKIDAPDGPENEIISNTQELIGRNNINIGGSSSASESGSSSSVSPSSLSASASSVSNSEIVSNSGSNINSENPQTAFDRCKNNASTTCKDTENNVTYTKVVASKTNKFSYSCQYNRSTGTNSCAGYTSVAEKGNYYITTFDSSDYATYAKSAKVCNSSVYGGCSTNGDYYEAAKLKCESINAHLANLAELDVANTKGKLESGFYWAIEESNAGTAYVYSTSSSNLTGMSKGSYLNKKFLCVSNN